MWQTIAPSISGIITMMTIIGVVLIVGALIKYFWDKRRGGGGNSGALMWTVGLGAVLSAPALIIPVLLTGFDIIANAVANVFKTSIT